MASKISFEELKASISVVDVAAWLGIKVKMNGDIYRGDCPLCEQERSFTLTPSKGLWGCFKCQQRGSIIDMVAVFRNVRLHQAGVMLHRQFLDGGTVNSAAPAEDSTSTTTQKRRDEGKAESVPRNSSPPNAASEMKPLDYLTTDHDIVLALKLTPEICEAMGWGYAPKGTARGRFLVALHTPKGRLVGYLRVATREDQPVLEFPPNLAEMVLEGEAQQEEATPEKYSFLRVAK